MSKLVVNKYIEKLDNITSKEQDSFFYIFRGQPKSTDLLNCSATRKFKKEVEEEHEILLQDDQVKLISDLEIRGFTFSKEKQRDLHDLETLADLRHYGTPSCLIDFTSNFLIALWFACEDKAHKDKNGKVFILNCYETDRFSVVSSKTIKNKIEYFFDDKFRRLWYWIPERLNQRLTDQDAVFVFGQPEIKEYECIEIDKDDKEGVLEELEKFFDYTKKTLFSDKYALGEIYKDFDEEGDGEGHLEKALHYIQTGDFSRAKERLDRLKRREGLFTDNKQLFLEAHFQSAFADIEEIKVKLIESKEVYHLASEHLQALGMKDEEKVYIKCFNVCIKNGYKKEKVELIQNEFEEVLEGLVLPPDELMVPPYPTTTKKI